MIPQSLMEIAAVIGNGKALQLCADFGGTEEYIPKKMATDHKIAKSIGADAALKLSIEYGGERLEIPRAIAVHQGRRNFKMREEAAAGMAKKNLARSYGMTERRVRQITNNSDAEKDPNQGNLF